MLANTEELHERIEHLCSRVRELEDALRALQVSVSNEPHPLLRTDLLQLKSFPARPARNGISSSSPESPNSSSTPMSDEVPQPRTEEENFVDAFGAWSSATRQTHLMTIPGTLTIGLHGESSFLGQTARSEVRGCSSHRFIH